MKHLLTLPFPYILESLIKQEAGEWENQNLLKTLSYFSCAAFLSYHFQLTLNCQQIQMKDPGCMLPHDFDCWSCTWGSFESLSTYNDSGWAFAHGKWSEVLSHTHVSILVMPYEGTQLPFLQMLSALFSAVLEIGLDVQCWQSLTCRMLVSGFLMS